MTSVVETTRGAACTLSESGLRLESASAAPAAEPEKRDDPAQGRIKCVVWDLDNTLWDGVLLEDHDVTVRPTVVEHIRRLDRMGVLHSVASKNDHDTAMAKLRELGLAELFLHPRIGWHPKSESIKDIAGALNLGLDAFAFVDDQPFELAEVGFAAPAVTCVDAAEMDEALLRPDFQPRFVTDESARRRGMYRGQLARDESRKEFGGTDDAFLASLDMTFTIAPAGREDLQRAEELTVRTNQLNATGRTYSYDELDALRTSPDHLLLVASLTDRFGSYGKVGLALVRRGAPDWRLLMLLMSCRVMSHGVGMIMLNYVMGLARDAGAGLLADLVETGRNRMMQVTYAFSGFHEVERDGNRVVLAADLDAAQDPPAHVRLEILE